MVEYDNMEDKTELSEEIQNKNKKQQDTKIWNTYWN